MNLAKIQEGNFVCQAVVAGVDWGSTLVAKAGFGHDRMVRAEEVRTLPDLSV